MKTAISVKNVSKTFKIFHDKPLTLKEKILRLRSNDYTPFYALKDVSFEIKKGETVGLIGHNGCGKSTLLSLIAGILYPNTGKIEVNGRVSSLIELGAGFHPDFTGRENIYTNASIFAMSKKQVDKYIDSIIDFSELGHFIDNPVRTYSSGMYLKLAFSVAIHINPEILLIDEILAVGDTNFQKKCFEKMMEFRRNCVTIVLVTHEINNIEKFCDRALWLQDGIIKKDGPPQEVAGAYALSMNDKYRSSIDEKNKIKANTESKCDTSAEEHKEETIKHAEITGVKMLDSNGSEQTLFTVGEKVSVVISFKVNTPVKALGFGVHFFSADGTSCFATNSLLDENEIKNANKNTTGEAILKIDKLNLIKGSYWLNVSAQTHGSIIYDYQTQIYSFATDSKIQEYGLFRLEHEWKINKK